MLLVGNLISQNGFDHSKYARIRFEGQFEVLDREITMMCLEIEIDELGTMRRERESLFEIYHVFENLFNAQTVGLQCELWVLFVKIMDQELLVEVDHVHDHLAFEFDFG